MKHYWKILLYLLTLLLVLSAFAGCRRPDDEEKVPVDDDYYDDGESFFPDVEKNDYGLDFTILASTGLYFWIDEDNNSGSPIDEAVYNRQDKVERYLGIDILKYQHSDDSMWNTYSTHIQTAVQNMDGTIDLGFVATYSASAISDNLIRDFNELNEIDLDADYWNREVMENLEINGGLYLGISDFVLLNTYCVSFNKDMLALYESSLDKPLYDTVKDREWTFDKMSDIANLVFIDQTGDGKTEDDVYGLRGRCWHPFRGFLTSANIPTMMQDESGSYIVAINQAKYFEKTDNLVEKLRELRDSNGAWFHYQPPNDTCEVVKGKCLLFLSSTPTLESYLDYNAEFGVLPYPMYDTDQASVGYRSYNAAGHLVVPTYLKNESMVAEAVELLSFYSANVSITYY